MRRKGTILVVDDEAYVRESLAFALERYGYSVRAAGGAAEALRGSLLEGVDLAVADLRMPDRDGLSLLKSLRDFRPDLPVIMLTAHGTVPAAVDCLKAGAADFLQKPADPEKLVLAIERALGEGRLKREVAYLRSNRSVAGGRRPVGRSAAWKEVLEMVRVAAPTDASVLVLGESGVGKEVVARLIHEGSPRAQGPFVRVNCAAIPGELFESEFFGHRKGAFTGAAEDRDGRFRVADRGSLLLDEIALMPAAAQAKVLRVLEDGLFERVGDAHPTQADVRVIASTNAPLAKEVEAGRFRLDLYYRLNVLTIEVPPLRSRREDIAALANAFAVDFSRKLGKEVDGVEPKTLEMLQRYDWPGNVRELRNVIERAVILERNRTISPASLPHQFSADAPEDSTLNLRRALAAEERRVLREALKRCDGVRRQAAKLLGIDERNMSYYLKKHDLH